MASPKVRKGITGDRLLKNISAIEIQLPNKTKVKISLADELNLPVGASSEHLAKELSRTTATFGFWSVQAARAERNSVILKRKYDRLCARKGLAYRKHIDDSTQFDSRSYGIISDSVQGDEEVYILRQQYEQAKYQSELVGAVKEVIKQRAFALSALLNTRKSFG